MAPQSLRHPPFSVCRPLTSVSSSDSPIISRPLFHLSWGGHTSLESTHHFRNFEYFLPPTAHVRSLRGVEAEGPALSQGHARVRERAVSWGKVGFSCVRCIQMICLPSPSVAFLSTFHLTEQFWKPDQTRDASGQGDGTYQGQHPNNDSFSLCDLFPSLSSSFPYAVLNVVVCKLWGFGLWGWIDPF